MQQGPCRMSCPSCRHEMHKGHTPQNKTDVLAAADAGEQHADRAYPSEDCSRFPQTPERIGVSEWERMKHTGTDEGKQGT